MDNPNPAAENELENFSWAVKTSDMNGVQKYFNQFGAGVRDQNQRTPLHWAADFGKVEPMQFLLKNGADVNAKDKFGITPLLAAVYEEHVDAVKALVAAGADKNAKGPDGMTAAEASDSSAITALLR